MPAVTHWSSPFIGMPFEERGREARGVDCYGLVRLVLMEVQRIALPSFTESYVSCAEREMIAAALDAGERDLPLRPIRRGDEAPFDIVEFVRGGISDHVGIVVERGRMLHIESGGESRIERYDVGKWLPRLKGFYRHRDLIR
jgi:cell wall-associated NlpC family hydrolase